MLKITNLHVSIADTPILKGLNLEVKPGTVHALMGPNGSGKSTLAATLMGHPAYTVRQGDIIFGNQSLLGLTPDKRAKEGIFLAFQYPLSIEGVQVATLLKEAHQAVTGTQLSVTEFTTLLLTALNKLGIDPSYAYRYLNSGFSGGEKKRLELLQMVMLKPKLAILDELDSGLDIDALKAVCGALEQARQDNPDLSIIIITHYPRILTYVVPDHVHIIKDGTITTSADAALIHELEHKGYDGIF